MVLYFVISVNHRFEIQLKLKYLEYFKAFD